MPFRSLLLTVVLGLILLSSGTTTWLVSRGAREAIRGLFEKQIVTTLEAVSSLVDEHFEPASRLMSAVTKDLANGRLHAGDPRDLALHLAMDLELEEGIAWVSFGYLDGGFAGARKEGDRLFLNVSRPDGSAPLEWELAENGNLVPFTNPVAPQTFDARTRPWFQAALQADGRTWSPPYDFAGGGRGITVSQQVHDTQGNLLGILTVDFLLRDIAAYLEKLTDEFRGQPVVFSINGQLLATPGEMEGAPVLEEVRNLVASPEFRNRVMSTTEPQIENIKVDGQDYYLGARAVKIPGGLECVSAILFNREQIFGGLDQVLILSISAAAGALVVSLGIGFLLASRIARPMQALAVELGRIGRFDLESNPLPGSAITEVKMLSDSVTRMRAGLRSFSHYVPVDLVRDLLKSGGVAELGGERREVAILFCDLAGFTAYSEKIPPETAVSTLTRYFEAFGSPVTEHGGVIDKFLGDGIMALFNAPAIIPDPAAAACRAVLSGMEGFSKTEQAVRDGFSVRAGLHWGGVLAGNVGTTERFSYTVIGDAVNLCSRLEGLNKFYGTRILASGSFRTQAGEAEFLWRKLDVVTVAGREAPLEIHELMGFRSSATDFQLVCATAYEKAWSEWHEGKMEDAAEILAPCAANDPPSRQLLERIRASTEAGVRAFDQK